MHGHIVAQREQLLVDAADELVEIAAGQIGAADAALEEHVAGDDEALRLTVEGDMPRSMPRNEEHLEFIGAERDHVAFLDEARRIGRGLAAHAVELALPGRQLQQREVGVVQLGQQAEALVRPVAAEDMIDVGVGEDEAHGRELPLGQPVLELPLLGGVPAARVDQDGALAIMHHIGVLLEWIEDEGSDAEHDTD